MSVSRRITGKRSDSVENEVLCLTATSSHNLDLNPGPAVPGDIINCLKMY